MTRLSYKKPLYFSEAGLKALFNDPVMYSKRYFLNRIPVARLHESGFLGVINGREYYLTN